MRWQPPQRTMRDGELCHGSVHVNNCRLAQLRVERSPVPHPSVMCQASFMARREAAAAYSMGGRSEMKDETVSPGPARYTLPDPRTEGNSSCGRGGRGYSFGVRDKTEHAKRNRYIGPLFKGENMGTQSPGPMYDVRGRAGALSPVKRTPDIKFGTAKRMDGNRVFISKLHAEAEGAGLSSPGPGTYDQTTIELASVTSRYRNPPSATFSIASRFSDKTSSF
jgi:hypothetical protein